MPFKHERAHCVDDFRKAARKRLPKMLFDYIDGGADQEASLRRNIGALSRTALVPGVLSPSPDRVQSVELFGEHLALPVLLSPTGLNGLFWPSADVAVARAAADAGTIMVVSSSASATLEEIASASPGPKWFQTFIYRERKLTYELVERARAAGYKALCVTVDVQAAGHRLRDKHNGFSNPVALTTTNIKDFVSKWRYLWEMLGTRIPTLPNFNPYGVETLLASGAFQQKMIDPLASWDDIGWLRKVWPGPLVIKGVLRSADALHAINLGADGIIVSNHGGRQFDGGLSTFEALPSVVDAVNGAIPVLLDGGIRSGRDVLKCLASGASTVLVGRPYLWGLAASGGAGVFRVLELMRQDIDRSLALGGWNGVSELQQRDLVAVAD